MTLGEQTKAAGTYVNISFLPGTASEVGLLSFANAGPYIKSLDLSNINLTDTKTLRLSNSDIMHLDISSGCDALEVIQWRNKPADAVIVYPTTGNIRSDIPVKLILKGNVSEDGLLRTAFCGMTHLRGLDYSQVNGLYNEHEISWPGYNASFPFKYSGPVRLNDVIENTPIPVKISFKEGIADTDCADMFCQKQRGTIQNILSVDFGNISFVNPVTDTSRMFYNNVDLQETVKNLDGSHVTDASEMYKGCASLKKIDLSNINTEHYITDIIAGVSYPEELILGNTTKELFDYAKVHFSSYLKKLSFNDFTNFIETLDISNCNNLEQLDFKSKKASSITWPDVTRLISLKLNLENFNKSLDLSNAQGLRELVLNIPKLPGLIINTSNSIAIDLSREPLLTNETLSLTAPNLDNLVLNNTAITSLDLTDYPVLHYINWSAKNCKELTDVVLYGYQAVNPDKSIEDEKNLEGCLNLKNILVKIDTEGQLSGKETHYTYESHSGEENHNGEVTFNGKVNFNAHQLLEYIYPVGSVYISQNDVSPATIFGGSWESKGTGTIGELSVNMWKRIS